MESIREMTNVWPLSEEAYALLAVRMKGGHREIFTNFSRQIHFTKRFVELYGESVTDADIPRLVASEEFSYIVKPLNDTCELMSSDGAFDTTNVYEPNIQIVNEVLRLANESAGHLLKHTFNNRIKDKEVLDELHKDIDGEKRSERAKNSKKAKLERKFKHDLFKYYLSCKDSFSSKLNASQNHDFKTVARTIESNLDMNPHTLGNFERHIYDTLRAMQELYNAGKLVVQEKYYSGI